MVTLKQKTINGMVWTMGERWSVQIIQTIVSIVLARLLEPKEFGLVGMLTIFLAVAKTILDSGFGTALIQKKNATQVDASSIFFFNIMLGFVLAGILSLFAPLIAKFYNQPILTPMVRVLSLSLIINAFTLVQTSLLTKAMDFKAQFKIQLFAIILSGLIGIIMAYKGMGVWSIVVQNVTNFLFRAIIVWIISKWRPSFEISLDSLKTMFSFGSNILLSSLIATIFYNIYDALIGKFFSATDLGFYSRAATLESAATSATSASIGHVTFPAFAPLQDDQVVLKQAYRKTIKTTMFLHSPLMVGLIAIADPLFRFLLTDKWAPSIPYFQLLCLVGLLTPLQSLNLNMLKVKGRSDLYLRLEIIKKVILILSIFLTFRWGIFALLIGKVVNSIIAFFINSYYSGHLIGYSERDQLKDIFPYFLTAAIMGTSVFLLGLIDMPNHLLTLIIQISAGLIIYYILNKLRKSPELTELLGIATHYYKEISSNMRRKK